MRPGWADRRGRRGAGCRGDRLPSGTACVGTAAPGGHRRGGRAFYNGRGGTLTTTGVSGSPMFATGNLASVTGGGITAADWTATTLTQTAVTANNAVLNARGVYREGGTMTTTSSPISANTLNNCVGSAPAEPNCTGDSASVSRRIGEMQTAPAGREASLPGRPPWGPKTWTLRRSKYRRRE
jgi:hypothetical protein